jgi:hypothetical protein
MRVCACGGNCFPRGANQSGRVLSIDREICDFLAQEENFVLNVVQYPYVGMDWRGCPNILFTTDEPPDDRGNIIIMF